MKHNREANLINQMEIKMKIMKKYLPYVLAGLVGAGIYDAGKTLVTRAFQTESMQRIVGAFKTYHP